MKDDYNKTHKFNFISNVNIVRKLVENVLSKLYHYISSVISTTSVEVVFIIITWTSQNLRIILNKCNWLIIQKWLQLKT